MAITNHSVAAGTNCTSTLNGNNVNIYKNAVTVLAGVASLAASLQGPWASLATLAGVGAIPNQIGTLRLRANATLPGGGPIQLDTIGLVGYWTFAGNNANDSSGQGNNGTLQNSPTFTGGQVGNAIVLNGTTQYVSIPDASSLQPASVTLSAWFYWSG